MSRKRKHQRNARASSRTTMTTPASLNQQPQAIERFEVQQRARNQTPSTTHLKALAEVQDERAQSLSQSDEMRVATVGQKRLYDLGQYLKQKRSEVGMTKREAVDGFSTALFQIGVADPGRDNDWLNRVERSNQRLEPAELWALLTTYKCDVAEKIHILSSYGFLDCFSPDPRHRQIMAIFGRVYFDIIANDCIFTALAEFLQRNPDLTLSPGDCLSILSSVVSLFGSPLPSKAVVLQQSQIRRV